MKVLKPGNKNDWSTEVECTGRGNNNEGCHALLLVEAKDLYIVMNRMYQDNLTFTCMECGAETDLSEEQYPSYKIKSKLRRVRLGDG